MKKEHLLLILLGFQVLIELYFIPSHLEFLERLRYDTDVLNYIPFSYNDYVFQLGVRYAFKLIGIVGIIVYLNNKNIFNPFLKVALIHFSILFLASIPNLIRFFYQNLSVSNWMYAINIILSLALMVIIFMIYPKEKISVKGASKANKPIRFVHLIIDGTLMIAISFQFIRSYSWLGSGPRSRFDPVDSPAEIIGFILPLYLLILSYYWISEYLFQQTIGKVITKRYVRRSDGSRAGMGTIFGRTMSRVIPFEPISYLSPESRGWHDHISDSNVFERQDGLEDGILEHLVLDENEKIY